MRRSSLVVASVVALSTAVPLGAVAGASVRTTPAVADRHVVVSRNVHHDVSLPLRDLKPTGAHGHAHPALRVSGGTFVVRLAESR